MSRVENPKKIIIIGAGISGLSSGIYGQKNGYITEIYEKNPNAGGLCTAWKRKGFTIDGCIHWLTGTKEGSSICNMWHECDAFTKEQIIFSDDFGVIECEGTPITLWCDLNKLEKELIEISPIDKKIIKKTLDMVIKFQNMPLPVDIPLSTMNLWSLTKVGISMIPYLRQYIYASHISTSDYVKKFKSTKLQYLFTHIVPGDGNLYSALYAFGTVSVKNGGVPKGGSLTLINNMVNEYERTGGIIHYNKEVSKIIIKDKKAIGVLLKDGSLIKADYIISGCDCLEVCYNLLENKYKIKGFEKRRLNHASYPTQSCVLATFSVDYQKIKELMTSHTIEFPCKQIIVGKRTETSIRIRNYAYDDSFTHNEKTIMNVLIPQSDSDYKFWASLREDFKAYSAEKNRIAEDIKKRILEKYPEIKNSLDLLDILTPFTFKRYTHAYHGAYMPFAYTSTGSMFYYNGYVKGVKNLQLSGQWTILPGGLPIAMMSGKFAIQRILKSEHKWFTFYKRIKSSYSR